MSENSSSWGEILFKGGVAGVLVVTLLGESFHHEYEPLPHLPHQEYPITAPSHALYEGTAMPIVGSGSTGFLTLNEGSALAPGVSGYRPNLW